MLVMLVSWSVERTRVMRGRPRERACPMSWRSLAGLVEGGALGSGMRVEAMWGSATM